MNSTDASPEQIAAGAAAESSEVACPYIGLKPFSEKERFLFFGREADAKRLVNKILSARVTLFYGPSGVGKSSLLIARVAPDLRDSQIGDSVVLVFDSWHEADPEAAIKYQIATALGSASATVEVKDSLAVLADRVNKVQQKPLVLIFDQFERFLVQRAGRPDPLRKELAAMLKASVDVHVILSLREEFLAGLEIFAREIVTIYDSKFRLEYLSDAGVKDAIVKPAEKFGVSVDPALVKALQIDLKQHDGATATASAIAPGVELPFLQLVCKELWQSRRPGENHLSLAAYTAIGRRDGIIQRYVDGLTATLTPLQREDAASVLRWLAPRSGVKQAFDASQLSEMTRLPVEVVQDVLNHFKNHWVLRDRLTGGVQCYELYHDVYIRVLSTWIDARLADKARREKQRERWARLRRQLTIAAALIIFAVAVVYSIWRPIFERTLEEALYQREIQAAVDRAGDLPQDESERIRARANATMAFVLAANATWRDIRTQTDETVIARRLDDLKEKFKAQTGHGIKSRSATLEDYISVPSCLESWSSGVFPDAGESAIVNLTLKGDLPIDKEALRCAWAQMASLARELAPQVAVPRRIHISFESGGPESSINFHFGEGAWSIPIVPADRVAIVLVEDLSEYEALRRVLEARYDKRSILVKGKDKAIKRVNALSLPVWMYPLLRAGEIEARPRETIIVQAAFESLLWDHPSSLITLPLVDYLMYRAKEYASSTVAEGARVRGGPEGIQKVLAKLVELRGQRKDIDEATTLSRHDEVTQLDFVFDHFSIILDMLSQLPRPAEPAGAKTGRSGSVGATQSAGSDAGYTDEKAAEQVLNNLRARGGIDLSKIQFGAPVSGLGSDTSAATANQRQTEDISLVGKKTAVLSPREALVASYDMSPAEVPQEQSPIRVILGKHLESCLTDNLKLKRELVQEIGTVRDGIRTSFGVKMPPPKFIVDGDAPPNVLVVTLGGEPTDDRPIPVDLEGDCVKNAMSAIAIRLGSARPLWLSDENIDDALSEIGGAREKWLRRRYRLTDLELLLRAVLSPQKTAGVQMDDIADGRTVRDLPNLLLSLIFWTQVCEKRGTLDELDGRCLVGGLRQTQRAGFAQLATKAPDNASLGVSLTAGLDALADSGPDAAESAVKSFKDALSESRSPKEAEFVRAEFTRLFAARRIEQWAERLQGNCFFTVGSILTAKNDRQVIDDFLDAVAVAGSGNTWPQLRLCRLLSDDRDADRKHTADELHSLLVQQPDSGWDASQAVALAVLALDARQNGALSHADLDRAAALLMRAFAAWSGIDDAATVEKAYSEAAGVCKKSKYSPRWCLSVLKQAVEAYDGSSIIVPLNLGLDLTDSNNLTNATSALALFDRAKRRLNTLSQEDKPRLSAWLNFGEALADLVAAENGDRAALERGAELLSTVAVATKGEQSESWVPQSEIALARIKAGRLAGDWGQVNTVLEAVPWRNDANLGNQRMLQALAHGDLAEAQAALAQSEIDDEPTRLFLRGLLQFLGREPSALAMTIKQIANRYKYTDYLRLMFFVLASRDQNSVAKEDLESRWNSIDSREWDGRVQQGDDLGVWQEMLIGHFLGHVPREALLDWVEKASSPRSPTSESRSDYLTEFNFYDAQLQSISGDLRSRQQRTVESLDKAIAAGGAFTQEYVMALYQRHALVSPH